MPNGTALMYAVVAVFGTALGGLLVAGLMRSRLVPVLRARKARRFDSRVRGALRSQTPDALAKVFRAALEDAVDPILHARHWTVFGRLSRRFRDEADRVERGLPEARAAGEALASALYGVFHHAEKMLESGPAAPGHQTLVRLELDFLLHLLRDGDAAGAATCAHQGISATKSPTLALWTPVWQAHLLAAEVAEGRHTFDEIDEWMRRADDAISILLLSWSASAHAAETGDEERGLAYLATYRGVGPHCPPPRVRPL